MERLLVGFAVVMMGVGFIIGNAEPVEFSILGTVVFLLGIIILGIGVLFKGRQEPF